MCLPHVMTNQKNTAQVVRLHNSTICVFASTLHPFAANLVPRSYTEARTWGGSHSEKLDLTGPGSAFSFPFFTLLAPERTQRHCSTNSGGAEPSHPQWAFHIAEPSLMLPAGCWSATVGKHNIKLFLFQIIGSWPLAFAAAFALAPGLAAGLASAAVSATPKTHSLARSSKTISPKVYLYIDY